MRCTVGSETEILYIEYLCGQLSEPAAGADAEVIVRQCLIGINGLCVNTMRAGMSPVVTDHLRLPSGEKQ